MAMGARLISIRPGPHHCSLSKTASPLCLWIQCHGHCIVISWCRLWTLIIAGNAWKLQHPVMSDNAFNYCVWKLFFFKCLISVVPIIAIVWHGLKMRRKLIKIWALGSNDLSGETNGKSGTFLYQHAAINPQELSFKGRQKISSNERDMRKRFLSLTVGPL